MARVTFVKKAQQRYETVPVIDPATGEPKKTPVMRDGRQKVTKHGKPVSMTVTEKDKSKPLPLLECDYYDCDINDGKIAIGSPYKHVTPKSGPYGGYQRNRHAEHPSWKIWELSNSWSARVAQVVDGFDVSDAESPDDVTAALEDLAGEIEGLADGSEEAAENIREGFGHDTYQSEEADSRAEELRGWADEVRSADIPDLPEPEETECDTCGGTGKADQIIPIGQTEEETPEPEDCDECDGTGQITPDEPTDEQMDEWREEAQSAADDMIGNSPV